ncbi:MAG TPA: glycerophosphodiester phosphodiesterase family protein [Capillibacterium sp.]
MKLKLLVVILLILVVGAGGLYALFRLPEAVEVISDPAGLAWLQSTLIAHRGLHDNEQQIPENSLPAFRDAIEKGYIIELDVAMTKDEKLVVYHDKKLRRGLGVDRYLHELTYEELSRYHLFGTTEKIPLFREVLTMVAGRVPLLIEIKNEGKVGVMERLVYEELQGYHGKYAIQSFNPFTVQWFRQNAPEVIRGQLAGGFEVSDYDVEYAGTTRLSWYKRLVLENLLLNFISRPHFIAYEIHNASQGRLKRLKKLGVPLLGWTVKTKAEYEEYKDKFDNLIVDAVLRTF